MTQLLLSSDCHSKKERDACGDRALGCLWCLDGVCPGSRKGQKRRRGCVGDRMERADESTGSHEDEDWSCATACHDRDKRMRRALPTVWDVEDGIGRKRGSAAPQGREVRTVDPALGTPLKSFTLSGGGGWGDWCSELCLRAGFSNSLWSRTIGLGNCRWGRDVKNGHLACHGAFTTWKVLRC